MTDDERKIRVLIIEDDPDLAEVYEMALTEAGCRIVGSHSRPDAACSDPALQLDESTPRIVILDEKLGGGISGIAHIPALRKAFPDARFILATGDAGACAAASCVSISHYDSNPRMGFDKLTTSGTTHARPELVEGQSRDERSVHNENCCDNGVDVILSKPFPLQSLIETVTRLAAR